MSTVVKRETRIHEVPKRADIEPVPAKSQFFNRELSLLEFHARVLEEALGVVQQRSKKPEYLARATPILQQKIGT